MNKLIELANKLDGLGFTLEANAVDTIIKKIAIAVDSGLGFAGWPSPGASADIERGHPEEESAAGQGETVLERDVPEYVNPAGKRDRDVPEGEKPSVGGPTVYLVFFKEEYSKELEAIFSSRTKAEDAIETATIPSYYPDAEFVIEEFALDGTESSDHLG